MIFEWKNISDSDKIYQMLYNLHNMDVVNTILNFESQQTEVIYEPKKYSNNNPVINYDLVPNRAKLSSDRNLILYKETDICINQYSDILNFITEYCPHINKFIIEKNISKITIRNFITLPDGCRYDYIEKNLFIHQDILKRLKIQKFDSVVFAALSKIFYTQNPNYQFILPNDIDRLQNSENCFNKFFNFIKNDTNYISNMQSRVIACSRLTVSFLDNEIIDLYDNNILLYLQNIDLMIFIAHSESIRETPCIR